MSWKTDSRVAIKSPYAFLIFLFFCTTKLTLDFRLFFIYHGDGWVHRFFDELSRSSPYKGGLFDFFSPNDAIGLSVAWYPVSVVSTPKSKVVSLAGIILLAGVVRLPRVPAAVSISAVGLYIQSRKNLKSFFFFSFD